MERLKSYVKRFYTSWLKLKNKCKFFNQNLEIRKVFYIFVSPKQETMKELKELIADCVMKNVRFPSLAGATYGVEAFFNGKASRDVAIAIGERLAKQRGVKSDSPFAKKTQETKAEKLLDLQIDTLVAIVEYKDAKAEAAKKAAETKAANAQKADTLRKLIAEKELDALGKQDVKDLEKMLAELEG